MSWTAKRTKIATRIADGLAGYFQYVNATQLLAMPGEDTAQFVMCQILQAQQSYQVKVSAQPPNWNGSQRIDAGLLPKAGIAATWYGVVEVKWITSSMQREKARHLLIEDCARVASVTTANLNAKFIAVGFVDGMLAKVFDKPHKKTTPESQRLLLEQLLGRSAGGAATSKSHAAIVAAFPEYKKRVPQNAMFNNGLEVKLLAHSSVRSGSDSDGDVLVWQVNQRRGKV